MSDNTKENKTVETQEETVQETVSETATIETTEDSTEATSDSSVASAEDVVTNSDNKEQDKPSLEQETVSDTTEPESGATTSVASFADKAKQLFQDGQWYKNKKILAAIIAVVGIFVWFGINSGPQSVINDIEVTFTGYSTKGKANLVTDTANKKIQDVIAKKVGLPNFVNDTNSSSYFQYADKYALALSYYNSVSINIDRSTELSNGDEVVVSITTPKDHPIKSETKTFKVEGLKEFQSVTLNDVINNNTVTFSGYNGYGSVTVDNSSLYTMTFSGRGDGQLKNGDTVTIKATKSLSEKLASEGKSLVEGSEYVKTVEGLSEITDISGTADLLSRIDDLVKDENQDTEKSLFNPKTSYVLTPEKTYIKFLPKSSTYYVNDVISIVKIYKVDRTREYEDSSKNTANTYYSVYGYTNVKLNNNNLDLSGLSSQKYYPNGEYKTLEAAESSLRANDYVEYTAK